MEKIHIVWNEVTSYSRFWAIVLFIGLLPGTAFYIGIRVERSKWQEAQLTQASQHILVQSQRGMCRVSDCTIQSLAVSPSSAISSTTATTSTVTSTTGSTSSKKTK